MALPILALTSAITYGVHVAATPPVMVKSNEKAFSAEKPYLLLFCLRVLDIASSMISIIEILLLVTSSLAVHFPQSVFIIHLSDWLSTTLLMSPGQAISAPPMRIIAGLTVVAGSVIRWWCYKEMGRHFTFRVTVLKSHTLVTTGPYSIVRHPAYSGGTLILLALPFWYASQGSWIYESVIARGSTPAAWFAVAATCATLGAPVAWIPTRRAAEEDALMRKEFGKAWDEWAEKVPYKFIPGII
ncbi:hypothetical protein D9619_011942 [Psilocybe cf. subviscida]|uniref:Protein-S-isoprenylcysteine O-methyltransferase n=1 Tax=Psilocybe cf. subviscida TaxID=2480587 RepID=A0A8H5B277_9AGAR|nr:hypothetical protein D9619_011942 [Psilocybe cf. subviscida]